MVLQSVQVSPIKCPLLLASPPAPTTELPQAETSLYLLGTQRLLVGALRKLLSLGCLCPLLADPVEELLHPCSEAAQLLHHAGHQPFRWPQHLLDLCGKRETWFSGGSQRQWS